MQGITHEASLEQFHSQIRFVLDNYKPHGMHVSAFQNVVIGGLGGSGIGGRIARLAFFTSFPIPVEVISEYTLPAYAGSNTLVILCSYSGNTEETLTMFDVARKRGCSIMTLCSGGKLAQRSQEHNHPCYPVPSGYQPRQALGFSLSTLLMAMGELNEMSMKEGLEQAEAMLSNNAGLKAKAAEMFACFENHINSKFVVICDMAFEAVATRFCQQLQENAKAEAFVSVLPEANHNMIESYYGSQDTNFIMLSSGLNPRVSMRFDFLRDLLSNLNARVYQFEHTGFSLNTMFEIIHVTDWVSVMLSNARQVNNMEVQNIARLKNYLDEANF